MLLHTHQYSPTEGNQLPIIAVLHTPGGEIKTQTANTAMPENKGKNRYRDKNENESEIKELVLKNRPVDPGNPNVGKWTFGSNMFRWSEDMRKFG